MKRLAIALALMGRRRSGAGEPLARTPEDMARLIIDQLTAQTSKALLTAAFAEESDPFGGAPADLAAMSCCSADCGTRRDW